MITYLQFIITEKFLFIKEKNTDNFLPKPLTFDRILREERWKNGTNTLPKGKPNG
jgi:hypothetical protein